MATTVKSQEVATIPQGEEATPKEEATPQVDTLPKVTGGWDALAYWVVISLMEGDPTLKEKGVTTKDVASFIQGMNQKVYKVYQGLMPQGTTLKAIQVTPQGGKGGWVRILENSLWRCCPSTPGNKQAGGGKYPQAKLLVRNMTSRPVTFTLDS